MRITVVLSLGLVAGCSVFKTEVTRQYAESPAWTATSKETPTLYTTADIRIVTKRKHPVLGNDVLCTEPSPDVSKALSAVTRLNAGIEPGTVNGSVGVGAGTAEELVQLAGRTTALLAFRDGVFRACEAYANGSLGADLYTLVAGNYTQLLTTLFLAQDMTGVVGTAGGTVAAAPTISLDISGASNGFAAGGSGGSAKNPANSNLNVPGANAGTSSPTPSGNAPPGPASGAGSNVASGRSAGTGAGPSASTRGGAGMGASSKPASASSPDSAHGKPVSSGGPDAAKEPPAAPSVPAGAGVNLVRMNEDYLGAAYNFPAALFLLCVNENDPTRRRSFDTEGKPYANTYLAGMCAGLKTPKDMEHLMGAYTEFVKAMQQAAPSVNPLGSKTP